MARRRDTRAPYEIMGAATRGSASAGPAPETSQGAGAPWPLNAAARWWEKLTDLSGSPSWEGAVGGGGGEPVVLRVPRGFAILIAAGMLGLIVLSYWVGYSRGSSAAQMVLDEQQAQLRSDRVPQMGQTITISPSVAQGDPGDIAGGGAVTTGDPRRPGLNYLIIYRYPAEEAYRLARFLREEGGVETAVVPSDNARLFHVVGLEGYTTEEYRAGRHHDYTNRMRELGRAWKAHNNGKGPDLSDMYWMLH